MCEPPYSMGPYSSSGMHGGRKLLHHSRVISIGCWGVGQAGGSGTTEREPLVSLVYSSGENGLFSASVANGPGIGLVCAPVTSVFNKLAWLSGGINRKGPPN